MSSSSQKGRIQWLFGAVGVVVVLWVGGWGSLSAQTDTENEAERTLRDLKINVTDDPNVAIPEIYKTPPKIFPQVVGGTPEWKLSYFCRNHKSDDLKKIVHEQFATKLFDKKGKETKMVDYTVSSNPSTNQLIVRCPAREDAEAVLELLQLVDVAPIQVKIDCLISEVYADMTFDRETTIAVENLFGESVAMKPGGTAFGADVRELVLDDEYLPAFPGASLREVARSRMGLNIGHLSTGATGHAFTLLIDLLESRGYLKILMNPELQVVNGGTAKVLSMQNVPLDRITMRSTQSDYLETRTEYIEVIDSLEITAHVFGDGSIGLETDIILGSKNTPEGVKQVPIVTKKEIQNKENRIRQGESLIIGGIRKNEEFAVVRGIPILKDIPIIGYLFSSEDTEQRAVETLFILTPTISTGGRPKAEVMEEVQRKHEPDSPTGLSDMITDPFKLKAREQARKQTLQEAEQSRLEAEVEKAQARIIVREANERAEKAQAELNRVETESEKIKADAQKTTAEAEAKAKAAEEAKAAADKAIADARKAQTEAEAKIKAAEEVGAEDANKPGAGAKEPAPEKDGPKAQEPKEAEKAKVEEDKAASKA
ncbi:MAG: type II secretion system protein GspD [Planctomycetota bacterium]